MARSSRTTKSFNFEQSLLELETIVGKMESDQLSLEDSLKNFEAGIALAKSCQLTLSEAEQKVSLLVENNHQELEFSPFPPAD